jgi:glycosyltransferase involved in cell wall biosynthesis
VATVHSPIHSEEARRHRSPAQGVYHDGLIRRYEARSCARARAVVAVSEAAARSVLAVAPSAAVTVIHNWVDTDRFRPGPARAPGSPFRLLFAGNRTRWKGWDLLPELMRRLGPDFNLSVAAGLRAGLPASALPPHATSLGALRDESAMVLAYQACDAVLVPSRLEGFGYVAAEAMACGKPVVAFDNSGLPEVVADGRTGLLVPTGDVGALADACRRLVRDPALRASLGEAARARAVERFDEAIALPRYLELYGAVTGSPGPVAARASADSGTRER